ncbi:MAG: O-antigen ligase family protein [Nevskia sp.]|nr:O-antigen ligase family protein [Nevskia sp.]
MPLHGLFGFVFWAFLTALIWAPFPLGSNRPWAAAFLSLWLWGLLLVLVVGGAMFSGESAKWFRRFKKAWLPLTMLAGFCGILALQLVPWWPDTLRAAVLPLSIPPEAATGQGPFTLDAAATSRYLISTLGFCAAFLLVLMLCDTRARIQLLLGTLLAGGVLQAIVAVVLVATAGHYQYFFYEFRQSGRATGTFPNPDHLAGYMELCLAAGIGLMVSQFQGSAETKGAGRKSRRQEFLLQGLQFLLSTKMLVRLMLVILVITLVMTHSRMGNAALLAALVATCVTIMIASPRLRRPVSWLLASMLLIDVIVLGQWVGLDKVVERVSDTAVTQVGREEAGSLDAARNYREETLEARMYAPRAAWDLAMDAPWSGHGGGTFFAAFPPFKTPNVYPQYFEHAHNDYSEVAADTGLAGLVLWLGTGIAGCLLALRMLSDTQPRIRRGVGVAAVLAALSLGLHSSVDFNLHIFANALGFTCLLSLVWAADATDSTVLRSSIVSGRSSVRSKLASHE